MESSSSNATAKSDQNSQFKLNSIESASPKSNTASSKPEPSSSKSKSGSSKSKLKLTTPESSSSRCPIHAASNLSSSEIFAHLKSQNMKLRSKIRSAHESLENYREATDATTKLYHIENKRLKHHLNLYRTRQALCYEKIDEMEGYINFLHVRLMGTFGGSIPPLSPDNSDIEE